MKLFVYLFDFPVVKSEVENLANLQNYKEQCFPIHCYATANRNAKSTPRMWGRFIYADGHERDHCGNFRPRPLVVQGFYGINKQEAEAEWRAHWG